MRTLLRLFLACSILLVANAQSADAQKKVAAPRAAKVTVANATRAKAFAKKNKLPTREVSVKDRNGAKLKRLFVPVLDKHQGEFFATFGRGNNTVIWKDVLRDRVHPRLMLGERDTFTHNSRPHHDESNYLGANYPARYIAMELTRPQLDHMVARFELVGDSTMWHMPNRRDLVGPSFIESSGCMWWLVHAETAPGVNLATTLGVGRSGAPENLVRKLLHQAGPNVSVVGVPVKSVDHFKQMTEADLIGEAPKTKRQDP
tara:strand:- start:8062 stop:8838 length:777 start_codon:yes stop_codon:yes gene_type:complete